MNLAGVVFVYRFCHVNETFHLRRIIKTQTPRAVVRSVSNATVYPQGYVYAVCNQGHYASVKIGYTALPIVERYLSDSYTCHSRKFMSSAGCVTAVYLMSPIFTVFNS